MSATAKKAREALKAKARRMATGETGKVDASGYMTPDALNADVKTGMRPVSPRAFKRGGKVVSCEGEASAPRADKAPRKRASGGKVEQPPVDRYINRDLKKANSYRDGEKHVGGMKSGGRAKKQGGGGTPVEEEAVAEETKDRMGRGYKTPPTFPRNPPMPPRRPAEFSAKPTASDVMTAEEARRFMGGDGYKKGGRTKKMMGGAMVDPRKAMQFAGNPVIPGMKKGGAAKFEGSTKDEAQDKKLAKKHGMSMKEWEASKMDTKHDKQQSMKGLKSGGRTKKAIGGVLAGPADDLAKSGLGGILPMALSAMNKKSGGRTERKAGGRVKPKTNINIVIQAGQKPEPMGQQMPPPPAGVPPLPMAPPAGPPMGMPMGMPPGPPPGLPAGLPPMPRKSGGRVARSYRDMTAGAGSGEGRIQKTQIASAKR